MIQKWIDLSKLTLYRAVGIAIISTVIIVTGLHASYTYWVLKTKIIEEMKRDSLYTLESLEKNVALLISSYTIHEYDTLIRNRMGQPDILAIIVEDYKMGKILGKSSYISGAIQFTDKKIVEFDPHNSHHLEALKGAYDFQQKKLIGSNGEELGYIKIYLSSQLLDNELNHIIVQSIVNVIALSLLLGLSLFAVLRLIVLKPLDELNSVIAEADENGIPSSDIRKSGTSEMIDLATAMENMILSIKESQNNLQTEHDRLAASEQQLLSMLELSPIAVRIATMDGQYVVFANKAYGNLIHKHHDDIIGQNPQNYYYDSAIYDDILQRLYQDEVVYNEMVELNVEGERLWVLASFTLINFQGSTSVLGWLYDVTDQKESELKLEHFANHDMLTGLSNRVFLASFMPRILARAKRNNTFVALLFIDLDGFKKINDEHGHEVGDLLLKDVALRLNSLIRADDLVSRLGGDEFTVMIGDLNRKEELRPLIERILGLLNEPFYFMGYQLFVSASIGVSFYPQDKEVDVDTLLRQADQAMYEAKVRGKNQFAYYEEIFGVLPKNTIGDASSIGTALKNGEFVLYYQPKVNMSTGQVLGVEALIRWNDPSKGMVYPDAFLPIIENRPLIYTLDQWVLRRAVEQLREWSSHNFSTKISINVSAYTFKQSSLIESIDTIFAEFPDVLPSQIEIEILETSALHDIDEIQEVIKALHARGITVALDDFGTGYSTLSYLKKLEIDYLKLDKSFVMDMLTDTNDLSILDATLGLAHAFNFKVIAEGVESIEHGNLLLQFGCELAQGYEIARPMSAEAFVEWIQTWKSHSVWTTMQKLPSHLMPMIYASVAHRNWFYKLESYWMKKETQPPQSRATECRFGNWLALQGEEFFQDEKEYEQMQQLHHTFHDLASKLITITDEVSRDELWTKILVIHLELIKMLERKSLDYL